MFPLHHPIARHQDGRPIAVALLRLHVGLRQSRLDRLLAEGSSPASDSRLALRAAQLAQPAQRAGLAAALRDSVRSINETALTLRRRPQASVDSASVRACAAEIRELAGALADDNARVRGIAMVRGLLTDGLSPLYARDRADQLHNSIRSARSAL